MKIFDVFVFLFHIRSRDIWNNITNETNQLLCCLANPNQSISIATVCCCSNEVNSELLNSNAAGTFVIFFKHFNRHGN